MSTRSIVLGVSVAASLAGCVERGDWKPAAQLQPQALGAQQTLAGAKLDAAAWPADQWWRAYADPQLDTLIAEALAGSPSLEIAEARLRAAQACRRRMPTARRHAWRSRSAWCAPTSSSTCGTRCWMSPTTTSHSRPRFSS